MSDSHNLLELDEDEHGRSAFKTTIALATVAVTLVTGFIGYKQASALNNSGSADVEAGRQEFNRSSARALALKNAYGDITMLAHARDERLFAAGARLRAELAPAGSTRRALLTQEAADANTVADDLFESSRDLADSRSALPVEHLSALLEGSNRAAALSDAQSEVSSRWKGKVAAFTAILTIFTISLYLFGLSLTIEQRVRYGIAAAGAALALFALGWSLHTLRRGVNRPPPSAAALYARGTLRLETAKTDEEYREAAGLLRQAIEQRPGFALAERQLALALHTGSSVRNVTGVTIVSRDPAATSAALEASGAALDHGAATWVDWNNHAWFLFATALARPDDDAARRMTRAAEHELEHASTLNPVAILPVLNQAAMAFSLHDEERATSLYDRALEMSIADNSDDPQTWVAAALSELDLIVARRPDRRHRAARLKERIVGMFARSQSGLQATRKTGRLSQVRLEVSPGGVRWAGVLEGVDPTKDTLAVEWAYEVPETKTWATWSALSGPVPPEAVTPQNFVLAAHERKLVVDGAPCLPAGHWKADFYVNGHLIATEDTRVDLPALVGRTDLLTNVSVCVPADWKQTSTKGLDGIVSRWESPDRSRWFAAVRLLQPLDQEISASVSGRALETAAKLIGSDAAKGRAVSIPPPRLDGPVTRISEHRDGVVLASAGRANDGTALALFAAEPGDGTCRALRTLTSFEETQPAQVKRYTALDRTSALERRLLRITSKPGWERTETQPKPGDFGGVVFRRPRDGVVVRLTTLPYSQALTPAEFVHVFERALATQLPDYTRKRFQPASAVGGANGFLHEYNWTLNGERLRIWDFYYPEGSAGYILRIQASQAFVRDAAPIANRILDSLEITPLKRACPSKTLFGG